MWTQHEQKSARHMASDNIRIDYLGSRNKFREVYTWIIKYYLPSKSLKYDYRVQFQEYVNTPNFSQSEIECKIFIPIIYA